MREGLVSVSIWWEGLVSAGFGSFQVVSAGFGSFRVLVITHSYLGEQLLLLLTMLTFSGLHLFHLNNPNSPGGVF